MPPLREFPVWIFLSITTVTRHFTEWFDRRFTVFPQAIGLAATWNPELQLQVATVISDEARARWNELDQGREQKSQFSDLLTFWSPHSEYGA